MQVWKLDQEQSNRTRGKQNGVWRICRKESLQHIFILICPCLTRHGNVSKAQTDLKVLLVGWAAGQQSTDGAKNPAGGLLPERAQNRLFFFHRRTERDR